MFLSTFPPVLSPDIIPSSPFEGLIHSYSFFFVFFSKFYHGRVSRPYSSLFLATPTSFLLLVPSKTVVYPWSFLSFSFSSLFSYLTSMHRFSRFSSTASFPNLLSFLLSCVLLFFTSIPRLHVFLPSF